MMYVIGLTGGIASGKSNISSALREAGAPVVDADEISRLLTAPGGAALPGIREAFGDSFFNGDCLNRAALGKLVFSDEEALKTLNSLTHPLIFDQIGVRLRALRVQGAPLCFLEAPLLYETGLDKMCDTVWCAWLPRKLQVARLMERDRITRKEALKKIQSQLPAMEKRKRSAFVIDTRGTREESAKKAVHKYRETLEALQKQDDRRDTLERI